MFDSAKAAATATFESVADLSATIDADMREIYSLDINIKERLITIEAMLLAICHKLGIPRAVAQYAIANQRYLLSNRFHMLQEPPTENDDTLPNTLPTA